MLYQQMLLRGRTRVDLRTGWLLNVVGKKKVVEGIARSRNSSASAPTTATSLNLLYRFLLTGRRMRRRKLLDGIAQQWLFKNLCSSGLSNTLKYATASVFVVNQTRLLPGSSPRKGRLGGPLPFGEGHIR